jgi:phosphopentomutase
MFKRIVVIVMDSVGAGAAPDAVKFGDAGANTLQHIDEVVGGMKIPNLARLGISRLVPLAQTTESLIGSYGKMREISTGKDTTSGHWEMMGNPVRTPFPVFYDGFPTELMETFTKETGCGYLGNEVASGTEIIERLGVAHLQTGKPIVYTSGDSVFQIAAHEAVIPLDELYRICKITRHTVCVGPYEVGRIIARPFIGEPGAFTRTSNRHDYSRLPEHKMVFQYLTEAGFTVTGIGKIGDIYAHIGLTNSYLSTSNSDGLKILQEQLNKASDAGLIIINLVDFDSLYGHRRNAVGYGRCMEAFDAELDNIMQGLHEDDLLLITADHGNDPTFRGTDHTREEVPLLLYSKKLKTQQDLGTRLTFADLGQTIMDNFGLAPLAYGTSFLRELR